MKTAISSIFGYTIDGKRPRSFNIRTEDGSLKSHFLASLIKTGSVTYVPLVLVRELVCSTHHMAPYQAGHLYIEAVRNIDPGDPSRVPAKFALCLIDGSSAKDYLATNPIPTPNDQLYAL